MSASIAALAFPCVRSGRFTKLSSPTKIGNWSRITLNGHARFLGSPRNERRYRQPLRVRPSSDFDLLELTRRRMTVVKRAAVVGGGPAGFFAAEALLGAGADIAVDMFERLPTPYGLVRSGVAPDHPKLKQVTLVFDRIMQSERFSYFGNVSLGRDITVEALRGAYDVVILAYGASTGQKLGIPGEDLPNSYAATEFVGWYNGHPDYRDHIAALDQEVAVVFGHGNVAADVARVLLKPVDELRRTDIAAHALEVLAESKVREVHVVGRRGPAQAKFTARELRELGMIPNCVAVAHSDRVVIGAACEAEIADRSNLNAAQNVEYFRSLGGRRGDCQSRRLTFHFCLSPQELVGDGRVEACLLRRNMLEGKPFEQRAVAADEVLRIDCGLVISSIGYRGHPVSDDVPFDARRGIVSNQRGRVERDGAPVPGLYVAGWLKRGATGIIGTNRADSIETVQQILADMSSGVIESKQSRHGLIASLRARRAKVIELRDWQILDAAERAQGEAAGKPREKFTRIAEMVQAVSATPIRAAPNSEVAGAPQIETTMSRL
jgi:ferredoxin/flavodoxin---NADP+ reductase